MSVRRIGSIAILLAGFMTGCQGKTAPTAQPATQPRLFGDTRPTPSVFGEQPERTRRAVIDAPPTEVAEMVQGVFKDSRISQTDYPQMTRYDFSLGGKTALHELHAYGRLMPDGKTELVLVSDLEENNSGKILAEIVDHFRAKPSVPAGVPIPQDTLEKLFFGGGEEGSKSTRNMDVRLSLEQIKDRAKAALEAQGLEITSEQISRFAANVTGSAANAGEVRVYTQWTGEPVVSVFIEASGFNVPARKHLLYAIASALSEPAPASRPATSQAAE